VSHDPTEHEASALSSGGVVAGFFSFTVVTDPDAHGGYNEWHQLDHLPEQMPLPGVAHGQRWVATPACLLSTQSRDSELASAQYLTIYLMLAPLEETLESFYQLALDLHGEDRFFPHRRAAVTGDLGVLEAHAAPRIQISAAAVPYRPNRGVYVVVGDGVALACSGAPLETLLGVDGVAGVWVFGASGSRARSARPGGGRPLESDVLVCYLDDDPSVVAPAIDGHLSSVWESTGVSPDFAGPFETIAPWSWDWFDGHPSDDDRLRRLEDRAAISDLAHAYAQAVDRKDIDAVVALFAETGELVVWTEPGAASPRTITGRTAIRESLSDLSRYRATFHEIASHTVDLRGDSATAQTGCVAHHITGPEGEERDRVWYLRYADTLIRESGGWRFAVRELRVEIVSKGPLLD
jgi:ketosteroid isomerase-like protein